MYAMDKERYKIWKIMEKLRNARGRHTELVTVYIPPGTMIESTINQLSQEQGTASNIKSKQTRKNVTDALEKIIQHLRLYKQTPEHGLAVFCGNLSEQEGVQNIELWAIEPKEPITIKMYRCDQTFVIEPLEKIMEPKSSYALLAVDNKTATIATLKGDRYNIVEKLTSGYSGKHRAGGQSHRRFERLIEEESHNFKKRIGEHANNIFLPHVKDLSGVIIGGPAATKEEFIDGDYLNHELKKKIVAIKDITYTDESGIRELVNASQEVLKDVEAAKHKKFLDKFMHDLNKEPDLVVYGKENVDKALEVGAVDTLLLSEALEEAEIDHYLEKAEQSGVTTEIVSRDFEEGEQLWNAFGGVVGLLRYKLAS